MSWFTKTALTRLDCFKLFGNLTEAEVWDLFHTLFYSKLRFYRRIYPEFMESYCVQQKTANILPFKVIRNKLICSKSVLRLILLWCVCSSLLKAGVTRDILKWKKHGVTSNLFHPITTRTLSKIVNDTRILSVMICWLPLIYHDTNLQIPLSSLLTVRQKQHRISYQN